MRTQTFTVTRKSLWAREQALKLMAQHGLFGWTFAFDGARRRAGQCRHPYLDQPGCIRLSVHYCERNGEADILDTILHEIAHALVGPGHHHDEVWKAKCREVGANPKRCYDSNRIDMPKGRWQAKCENCGSEFHRLRRPRTLTGWHCAKCGREKGKITWTDKDK
jgi:predicted SprT family Zn-dependent metalloprotease